jgi:hypothetical protein
VTLLLENNDSSFCWWCVHDGFIAAAGSWRARCKWTHNAASFV